MGTHGARKYDASTMDGKEESSAFLVISLHIVRRWRGEGIIFSVSCLPPPPTVPLNLPTDTTNNLHLSRSQLHPPQKPPYTHHPVVRVFWVDEVNHCENLREVFVHGFQLTHLGEPWNEGWRVFHRGVEDLVEHNERRLSDVERGELGCRDGNDRVAVFQLPVRETTVFGTEKESNLVLTAECYELLGIAA